MNRLHLEPERIAEPDRLASRLIERDPAVAGLWSGQERDDRGEEWADRPGASPLSASAFHCADSDTVARLEQVLSGHGLVVTTGQQPQLFGGPLYVLYKALSAVQIAERIENQTGRPCLAVFWVAGDDHDWPEVASVGYLDRQGALRQIRVPPPPTRAGYAVGPSPLPSDIREVTREFLSSLEAHDTGQRWLEILTGQYVPGRSFTEAFIGTASEWMDGLPIAFLDSAHPDVRQVSSGFAQEVLRERQAVDDALRKGMDDVTDLGFPAQLVHATGAIPLFREGIGGRYRLRGSSGAVQVDKEGSSREESELLDEIVAEPQRFSPSAALRPALESWLLPVAATVLGPGEIAYWSQLEPLFGALGVPMPLVFPRGSWRVVEPRIARLLDKAGVTADALRDGGSSAAARIVERGRPRSVQESLDRLEERVQKGFAELDDSVAVDLPGLRPAVGKSRSQVGSALGALRKTLDRTTRDRESALLGQVRRAAANLYPDGIPQERALAVYVYLARHGERFLEAARMATFGAEDD